MKKILLTYISVFLLIYSYAQDIAGIELQDFLQTAIHPSCPDASNKYIVGPPNDSIWVNLDTESIMTGYFNNSWRNGDGDELLLESSYNFDNYSVRLILSNGSYTVSHQVSTSDWIITTESIPWFYYHSYLGNCIEDYSPDQQFYTSLDFSEHFGLDFSDVVTGIEINFLMTSGAPDLAGVYISEFAFPAPSCNISPSISSSSNSFIFCPGDSSLTITVEMPLWVENPIYSWSTGESTDSIIVTPGSPSTYTIDVFYLIDADTCSGSTTIDITFADSIDIVFTEDLEVCFGDTIPISVSGGENYFWDTGDIGNTILVAPDADTDYMVTVTDEYNCSASDAVTVLVHMLPDTTFLAFTSCDSLAVGNEIVVLSDQNGCDSVIVESTTLLLVPEAPMLPSELLIEENEPPFEVTFAEVSNADEYLWTVPAGVQIISGQNTNSILVDWNGLSTGGNICASAINECGSSPTSCMEVTVDFQNSIHLIRPAGYSIFPNPASKWVYVILDDFKTGKIEIYNSLGYHVLPPEDFVGQRKIDLYQLPGGMYWMKISIEKEVFWERLEVIN